MNQKKVLGILTGVVVLFIVAIGCLILTQKSKNEQLNRILLDDLKELRPNADMLISHKWDVRFAVYAIEYAKKNRPYGQESALVSLPDLVILNLETGERKVVDAYNEIAPKEMFYELKEAPALSNYDLHIDLLRWAWVAPNTKNTFWGKLSLYAPADPPFAEEIAFFKFDIENSRIEKFYIPNHGLFGEINENTNIQKVLYESFGNGLSLYLYDWANKKEQLIIAYPKDIFNQYCKSSQEYVYGYLDPDVDCSQLRKLNPEWEKNGISYIDFITREKVIVGID